MHLTNIKFAHDEETDGVYIEDEYPLEVGKCRKWPRNILKIDRTSSYFFFHLKVSNLLAIEQEILATALISNFSITKGEKVISLKNRDQANDCRDALAKALYERLFGWIVRHINDLLQSCYILRDKMNQYPSIAILDMSGFENFQVNSFEQLCINVANEHLQFFFNEHIFLQEEEEYSAEGIDFSKITFQNNEDLIEVFMGVYFFFIQCLNLGIEEVFKFNFK